MKKLGLALFMAMVMVFAMDAAGKKEAKIKFEKTVYDFGNIKEDGGEVTHEFVFTNEGNAPLRIESARAECGCTKPEFPENEIAPGAKGKIKVTYNPYGRPGGFVKKVTIRSNATPEKATLKIRGTVVPRK